MENHLGKVIQEIQIVGNTNKQFNLSHVLAMVREKQKVFQPLGVSPARTLNAVHPLSSTGEKARSDLWNFK